MLEKIVTEMTLGDILREFNLSEREKKFLCLRFDSNGEIVRTLKEVGHHFHVSKQRACAIQIRILEKVNGKIRLTIQS